ncbi:MAG: response regulator transcription factor [Chloroflexaceae bacterium]
MTAFRILLVDNSPDFLRSAARFLAADPQVVIVGQAESGHDALNQIARLHPDLVLIDISMPHMNGLEATRFIKARPDAPRVVVLTNYDTVDYRAAATAAGADGFIAKSEFSTQVFSVIYELLDTVITALPTPGVRNYMRIVRE